MDLRPMRCGAGVEGVGFLNPQNSRPKSLGPETLSPQP